MDYPTNTLELDVLLNKLIQNPFLYIYQPKKSSENKKYLEDNQIEFFSEDVSEVLYSEEKKILKLFLRPIEIVLRPHITISQEILKQFYNAQKDVKIKKIIQQYGSDLIEKLESIRKFYRIFIEVNTESSLELEANKLVKRFFGDNYNENHKNFIKLKRYIERLKSFYEQASKLWKDVEKLIDTFLYIDETKTIVLNLKQNISRISLLNHQTDIFLKILINRLKISDFNYNPSNFSFNANMTYTEEIDYTLEGIYESLSESIQEEIKLTEKKKETYQEIKSPIETIIIESEIKKFYRNVLYTNILGSKDWNRTKDYYLELNKEDYQKDLNKFYQSIYIIYDKKTFEESISMFSSVRTGLEKKDIEEIFQYYINMIQGLLNENYQAIINNDFAGIIKPTIFFYHIGANTFYSIIKEDLREKKLGEILYLENQLLLREYPYNLIKKILIDWWNELTSLLDIEEIDSYWIYSIHLEYVLQEYLKDYELIRKESIKNHISNYQFDEWFKKNYRELLGLRKYFIYKRFYPTLLIDL